MKIQIIMHVSHEWRQLVLSRNSWIGARAVIAIAAKNSGVHSIRNWRCLIALSGVTGIIIRNWGHNSYISGYGLDFIRCATTSIATGCDHHHAATSSSRLRSLTLDIQIENEETNANEIMKRVASTLDGNGCQLDSLHLRLLVLHRNTRNNMYPKARRARDYEPAMIMYLPLVTSSSLSSLTSLTLTDIEIANRWLLILPAPLRFLSLTHCRMTRAPGDNDHDYAAIIDLTPCAASIHTIISIDAFIPVCATGVSLSLLHHVALKLLQYPRIIDTWLDGRDNDTISGRRPAAYAEYMADVRLGVLQHPDAARYISYYHWNALVDISSYVRQLTVDISHHQLYYSQTGDSLHCHHVNHVIDMFPKLSFPRMTSLSFSYERNHKYPHVICYDAIPSLISCTTWIHLMHITIPLHVQRRSWEATFDDDETDCASEEWFRSEASRRMWTSFATLPSLRHITLAISNLRAFNRLFIPLLTMPLPPLLLLLRLLMLLQL
jgi:hypothetical protein